MAFGFIDHPRVNEIRSQALSHLVPSPEARKPISLQSILPSLALLWILAYLVRKPNTYLLRLAIFPLAFASCLRLAFGCKLPGPDQNGKNLGWTLAWLPAAVRTIDLGLYNRKGQLRVGELEPGKLKVPASGRKSGGFDSSVSGNSHTNVQAEQNYSNSLWGILIEGLDTLVAMRGIGWEFGTGEGIYLKPDDRDTGHKTTWWLQTVWKLLKCFIVMDFVVSCFKLLPGFEKPVGATIFAYGRNVVEKYIISSLLSFMTGLIIITSISIVYHLSSLVSVGLLNQSPASWPPLFDRPLSRTSLHDFWSKGWHQLLRRTFIVMLGRPLQYLFGFGGLVVGSFTASGIYHSWALYALGGGPDYQTLIFFSSQPVGFLLERLFRRIVGKRIGGWFGMIWVYLWIVVGGQWCMNAWHSRGLMSGVIIPLSMSPARQILLPNLAPLTPYIRPFFYANSAQGTGPLPL